jgi:adenylate cyclase
MRPERARGDSRWAGSVNDATGTILVVDDNPIHRMLLVRSLERDGHTVDAAENGRQGLEMLA